MRRLVYILPLAVFIAVAGYFLIGLRHDPSVLPSALIDKPVPTFDLPPLPGRAAKAEPGLATSDLEGGGLKLVNFFASWCIPCRAEHPIITRLAGIDGLAVHAINYKDKPAEALAWLERLGDPYGRIGADRDGRAGIEWGIYGVPETFLVDSEGTVRFRYPGPLNPAVVEETLLPLIEELRG